MGNAKIRNRGISTLLPVLIVPLLLSANSLHAERQITIEGTLTGEDIVEQGTYPYRLQYYSNDVGGTPLKAATVGKVSIGQEGQFEISTSAPDPSAMAPVVWMELYFDLDKDGFEWSERLPLGEEGHRAEVGSGPLMVDLDTPAARPVQPQEPQEQGFLAGDGVFNVQEFGAKGDGETDDTAAIQKTIDQAERIGGIVYLPPGRYSIRSLDLTNCSGLAILGTNITASVLVARESDVNMIDLTGAANIRLENFMMVTGDRVPYTAILLGQTSRWPANVNKLRNFTAYGNFSVAACYIYGCQSSDMIRCVFGNAQPSDAPAVAFTATNYAGVKSEFTEIATTRINCSDWTLVACEIHSFSDMLKGERSEAPALRLDGTMQMRWVGGNISALGPAFVKLTNDPGWTIFSGTTFYTDNFMPPTYGFLAEGPVHGLTVDQCVLEVDQAIFGGEDAHYDTVNFSSPFRYTTTEASKLGIPERVVEIPGGTLSNSIIFCAGKDVIAGEITGSLLLNAGEVQGEQQGAEVIK